MAHINDFACDDCGTTCSQATVDGKSVPLVVYVVVGVPPAYQGPPVGLNDPGVKVPELIRELMRQPTPRREWGVECFAKEFGLTLVEAPSPARETETIQPGDVGPMP